MPPWLYCDRSGHAIDRHLASKDSKSLDGEYF